ncbi:hypothetical protein ACQP2P_00855 [Dactylosporangium sp. CA-139114]|uniref:hypothetical protein n=1 Tax=Dactylosporangium sp. CA-139114 TaxID=3239931 RepID=UPI003D960944
MLLDVEPPEEQRCVGVVGEIGDPPREGPPERLGRERISRDLISGREQVLGALAHALERQPGGVEMRSLLGELGFE